LGFSNWLVIYYIFPRQLGTEVSVAVAVYLKKKLSHHHHRAINVPAQSTTEAKYMAINEACKEVVWLKGLFAELCGDDSCIKLFVTVKVLFILLKIRCSMRGQSTLILSTTMFMMWLHEVNCRYPRLVLIIILLI
jgi:hypothetical protein